MVAKRRRSEVDAEIRSLVRAIFDPLFSPTPILGIDPESVRIAEDIYARKDWVAMSILADSLDDNSPHVNPAILSALRRIPGVRGHWALDLILGKS
jgi:hypothetical protein